MNARVDLQSVLSRFAPEPATLYPRQRQVCIHIRACRTPALGGLTWRCGQCAYERPVFHACRDRHCPKYQRQASEHWAERQRERLLPVAYFHVVFTLPDDLNAWVQLYPRLLYDQLFTSAWTTLSRFAANPRRLGGRLGMNAVLHTWGQTLIQHVHLHCLVPGGALAPDGTWHAVKSPYLFMATDWVVYSKPAIGRPEAVVDYLARYTHRAALTDGRLVGGEHSRIGLRHRDYRDDRRKVPWLEGAELIRRFFLHVLPKGLMRIRHHGLLANRCYTERLAQVRAAIGTHQATATAQSSRSVRTQTRPANCPRCSSGRMRPMVPLIPRRLDGG